MGRRVQCPRSSGLRPELEGKWAGWAEEIILHLEHWTKKIIHFNHENNSEDQDKNFGTKKLLRN